MFNILLEGEVIADGLASGVAEVTSSATSVLSLVSKFPLNIFLGAIVVGIGIGIYKKLRG